MFSSLDTCTWFWTNSQVAGDLIRWKYIYRQSNEKCVISYQRNKRQFSHWQKTGSGHSRQVGSLENPYVDSYFHTKFVKTLLVKQQKNCCPVALYRSCWADVAPTSGKHSLSKWKKQKKSRLRPAAAPLTTGPQFNLTRACGLPSLKQTLLFISIMESDHMKLWRRCHLKTLISSPLQPATPTCKFHYCHGGHFTWGVTSGNMCLHNFYVSRRLTIIR